VSHSSDSLIYMCYGNSNITTDQSNPSGVWDVNFKGVWHLGNGSTLSVADATNQLNGTNHGATAVTGKVAGGAGFNGTNQNVGLGTSNLTSGITLESTVYRTGNTNNFDIFADFGWNSTDGFVALVGGSGVNNHGFVKHLVQYVDSGVASPLNSWEHIVWTVDADKKPRLFVNGALVYTSTDAQSVVAATHGGSLGSRLDSSGNASQYFAGNLDEVRLSSTVRSADWIKTEYNNQNSPASFYAISSASGGVPTTNINWLVTDQLGTPRMIVDQSGSLASVKRHDYLPFGEEIGGPQVALIGGRTTAQGYSSDATRQKFTGYETDAETGLNFAEARYQSSVQGRFTSVDPLGASANLGDPQSFNRYSYVNNNPTSLTDPSGFQAYDASNSYTDAVGSLEAQPFDPNASHFGGPPILYAAGLLSDISVMGARRKAHRLIKKGTAWRGPKEKLRRIVRHFPINCAEAWKV
jgi:RHS repeat-associated protein